MNGKKIEWQIKINPKYTTIYNFSRCVWQYTGSVEDRNHVFERSLWDKIAFRGQINEQ